MKDSTQESRLLLHSLSAFKELVFSCFERARVSSVVEVGVGEGEFTRELFSWLRRYGQLLVCIDPNPPEVVTRLGTDYPWVEVRRGTCLEVLPSLPGCDAYILDGDHNYYTVSFELRTIERACSEGRTTPLVLVHDVSGPWARRDSYFDPKCLPLTAVHACAPVPEMILAGDLEFGVSVRKHLMGSMTAALHTGGDANGVMTAIEDFVRDHPRFTFNVIPCVFGLGVLFDRESAHASELDGLVAPLADNPLLRRLESNRLALYEAYVTWRLRVDATSRGQGGGSIGQAGTCGSYASGPTETG